MPIKIGSVKYSLAIHLFFNYYILDLDADSDSNQIEVLNEPVFDNELFGPIIFLRIIFFIAIRYTNDKMKWWKNPMG